MTTAVESSDSAKGALAVRYGLVGLDALIRAGSSAEGLVAAGELSADELAFLDGKLAAAPLQATNLLDAGVERGYLTQLTADKVARKLRAQGPDRDYEAACALFNHDVLPLHEVVELLEALDRPLQYDPSSQTAYAPSAPDKVDPGARSATGKPLVALTTLPERKLEATGLPELERLVVMRQDAGGKGARAARLVLLLARHYRLITPEQAELLAGEESFENVQEAVQFLFEEGLLTTSGFRFLLSRAEEVIASKGKGVTGTDKQRPLFELAMECDYLSAEALDNFLEEWQVDPAAAGAPEHMDLAVIALLFNRGYLVQYQAIDLLEKRGILLDHSPVGEFQALATGDQPGKCPQSGARMVRLTGWSKTAQLKRPLPEISRLVIHDLGAIAAVPAEAVAAEAVPSADGLDGSMILSLTAVPEAAEVAIDEELLAETVERYHLLDEDQRAEALRIQKQSQRPLFDVLREFGFLAKPSEAFLRRKLGLAPSDHPPEGGLMAVGAHYGHLRTKKTSGREILDELRLLGKAYNKGQLRFWQLMEMLEAREVWLEHSEDAQTQLYFAPGERDDRPVKVPAMLGELVALSKPGGTKGPLPRPRRIQISRLDKPVAPEATPAATPIAPAPTEEMEATISPVAPAKGEAHDDPLVAQLVLRYRLLNVRELRGVQRAWQKAGQQPALPQYLFEAGKITRAAMDFLLHKEQQFAGGEVQAGELEDERLEDMAKVKGYVARKRMEKLFRAPGAPSPDESDDLQIGCYLLAKGALTFYQLIDLFEEKGYFLLTREDHSRQYHLTGDADPTLDYADPVSGRLLIPLTSSPGYPALLQQLPDLKSLSIERRSALPLLGDAKPTPRTADDILDSSSLDGSMFGLSLDLLEINLDGGGESEAPKPAARPRPSRKKSSLQQRGSQAKASRQRSDEAVKSFYDKSVPGRKMAPRKRPQDEYKIDLMAAVGMRDEPDLKRVVKSQERSEALVAEGQKMLARALMIFALVIGVVGLLALGVTHLQGEARRAALAKQKLAEQAPKTETKRYADGTAMWVAGAVIPNSLQDRNSSFRLQLDLVRTIEVRCIQEESIASFQQLGEHLRQASAAGKPLILRVSGFAKTEAGIMHIQGAQLQKQDQLPAGRIGTW